MKEYEPLEMEVARLMKLPGQNQIWKEGMKPATVRLSESGFPCPTPGSLPK